MCLQEASSVFAQEKCLQRNQPSNMNRAIEFFNTKEGPAHMINSGAKVSFETANDHLHHCEGFCGQVHKLSPATHKST